MRIRIRVFSDPADRPGAAPERVVTAGGAVGMLTERDAGQVYDLELGPTVLRPWTLALPLEDENGRRRVVVVDVDPVDTIEEGD